MTIVHLHFQLRLTFCASTSSACFPIARSPQSFRVLNDQLTIIVLALNLNQGFLGSLIDEQVDSAIKSISGSPLKDHERIYSAQSGRRGEHVTLIAVYSSPSKSGSITNAARIASTNSSPGSDRAKSKLESPNWRIRDVAFGSRSGNPGDDVFISRDNSSKSPGQG